MFSPPIGPSSYFISSNSIARTRLHCCNHKFLSLIFSLNISVYQILTSEDGRSEYTVAGLAASFSTNSSHHTITRYYLLYYLPLTNTNTMTSNWSRWLLHKPRARDGSGPLRSPNWAPWHLCTFEGNVLRSDNIHTKKEERGVLRAFEEQRPVMPAPFVASSFTLAFLISRVGIF